MIFSEALPGSVIQSDIGFDCSISSNSGMHRTTLVDWFRTDALKKLAMGKTLFWYIFRDLLKVFLLASGAIAGIMSFGALLRPLTQRGLDGWQVTQMLAYFLPAMTNYSWPVAALFATTFVYGRLAADNELTACRASGISYGALMFPAWLLGVIVCLLSLVFGWFIVPGSFLRAERVIYSNFARIVANEIERTQRISFDSQGQKLTVFANKATVVNEQVGDDVVQSVRLDNAAIVTYLKSTDPNATPVPDEFYLARIATAVITMPDEKDGEVQLLARLTDGAKIPRPRDDRERASVQAQIRTAQFGPYPLPSPVRETSRFMDGRRLMEIRAEPEKAQRVARSVSDLVRSDQQRAFFEELRADLTDSDRTTTLEGRADSFTITAGAKEPRVRAGRMEIIAGNASNPGVSFKQTRGLAPIEGLARQVSVRVFPDSSSRRITIEFDFQDAFIWVGGQRTERQNLSRTIEMEMPESIHDLAYTRAADYLKADWVREKSKARLRGDLTKTQNQIEAEIYGRLSFALSCLVLVLVGATIGMMFKSGNFVSAFALSTVPAIVAIMLIITGQHVAESVPREIRGEFNNPLNLGLTLLAGGNLAVLVTGFFMFLRLRRT